MKNTFQLSALIALLALVGNVVACDSNQRSDSSLQRVEDTNNRTNSNASTGSNADPRTTGGSSGSTGTQGPNDLPADRMTGSSASSSTTTTTSKSGKATNSVHGSETKTEGAHP